MQRMDRCPHHPRTTPLARGVPSLLGVLLAVGLEQALGTAGMLTCLAEANQTWEREVERTLATLERRLPAQERGMLEAAQQRWSAWRDAEIRWLQVAYGLLDGSLYRVLHACDRLDVVRSRAQALAGLMRLLEEERTPLPD